MAFEPAATLVGIAEQVPTDPAPITFLSNSWKSFGALDVGSTANDLGQAVRIMASSCGT